MKRALFVVMLTLSSAALAQDPKYLGFRILSTAQAPFVLLVFAWRFVGLEAAGGGQFVAQGAQEILGAAPKNVDVGFFAEVLGQVLLGTFDVGHGLEVGIELDGDVAVVAELFAAG